jgi:hypothetical protein
MALAARAMATRVATIDLAMGACDKEGNGGKAMEMGKMVVGDKEGKGNEEGYGVGDEGGVQQR